MRKGRLLELLEEGTRQARTGMGLQAGVIFGAGGIEVWLRSETGRPVCCCVRFAMIIKMNKRW